MSNQQFIIGLPEDPEIHLLAKDLGYTSVILRPQEKPLPDCHTPLQQYVGIPFYFPHNSNEALKAIQKPRGENPLIIAVDPVSSISVITKFVAKTARNTRPVSKPILIDISRFLIQDNHHHRDPLINRSHALYLMKQTIKILESNQVPLLFTTNVTKNSPWRMRSPKLLLALTEVLGVSRKTALASIKSVPQTLVNYWKMISPE
ncbi:MAG: hypothetical protein ACW976_04145 [Candidatus Ranarchaeia archaeon]|jgi:hypothetical protein